MDSNVNELLDKISEHVKGIAKTETILGDEFTMGDYVCKPVIKMGVGFGSGSGSGNLNLTKNKGEKNGAGAGIGISPVGFLIAKGDEISFIPTDKSGGFSKLLDKVPDILEKIMDMKQKKEREGEESSGKKGK